MAIAAATGGDLGDAAISGAVGGAIMAVGGPGFLQGAAAGAASSAAVGRDPALGAAYGAGFGLVSTYVPAPEFQPFGGSGGFFSTTGNQIFNDGLRGAATGATLAAIQGQDIGKGAAAGAAVQAGAGQFHNLIGHAVGRFASGGKAPIFRDGAFIYRASKSSFLGGFFAEGAAITFGRVVTINGTTFDRGLQLRTPLPGETIRDFIQAMEVVKHEFGHMNQYKTQGPMFLAIYGAQLPFVAATYGLGLHNCHPMVCNLQESFGLGEGVKTSHELVYGP